MSRSWGVDLDAWTATALACGALCVYSLDHWGDAQRVAGYPRDFLSPRRAFYVETRMTLLMLAIVSTALGLWASLHLTPLTLYIGLGFVLLCALYLWSVQRASRLPKEALVCVIYTFALSLPALSDSGLDLPLLGVETIHKLCSSALIGCLAWANLCLISAYELTQDRAEGIRSIATSRGEYTTRSLGRFGLYVGALLWSARLISEGSIEGALDQTVIWADTLVSAAMLLTLITLYYSPRWIAERDRYRVGADLVFLYPLLSMIVA